jgi:hypothetical protein
MSIENLESENLEPELLEVEFLLVCSPGDVNEETWRGLLQTALETNLNEYGDEEVKEFLQFTLSRSVTHLSEDGSTDTPKEICCLELTFPKGIQNLDTVIHDFAKALEEEGGALHVLKFYDDTLLNRNLKFVRELFTLEMKLRKALSLIYLSVYCDKPFDLLAEETVTITSKEKPTERDMKESLENEFFHLLFSQYISLNQRKVLTQTKDLLELIRKSDTFEMLRDEIERSPITDENDQGFVASLQELMNSMEKLRNSVAHNRTPSRTAISQFETTKTRLYEGLEGFLARFTNLSSWDDSDS